MLGTSNDNFITINNIELGEGVRIDKFPSQILQKWASVPRLLSRIVDSSVGEFIDGQENENFTVEKDQTRVCSVPIIIVLRRDETNEQVFQGK